MESTECKDNAAFHGALSFGRIFHERVFSRSEERDFLRKIEKNDGHLIQKEMRTLWNTKQAHVLMRLFRGSCFACRQKATL